MANRREAAAAAPSSAAMVQPPEDMARVGSVANAPWWDLKNGNVLYGTLINVYDRPDERSKTGRSKFFQVELLAPTDVRFGRGDKAKPGRAEAGSVVNLNYGPKTKAFEEFVPSILQGAAYTVWVKVDGEKFDIGRGQTMWPLDCRAKQVRAASVDAGPEFEGEGDDEGDQAGAEA